MELPAFGCLRGFQTELAPGLNLFYGLNEAGKSTLQQAVCALLYGFYDHDRARPDETARHERFRPWPGGPSDGAYRGALQYELDDGRLYEVRRDFSTADIQTQLIDLATGVDIAGQFGRGRHGSVAFARRHLGMSRGVFQSCAFISQGEVLSISDASPREIGDAVAALADSARRDVSAANAIARLDALIARIGTDRARTAALPRAREHLRGVREELAALDAARTGLAEKAARLDQLQAEISRLCGEAVRTELLLHRAQGAALRTLLDELDQAEARLSRAQEAQARLKAYAGISPQTRDELMDLRGRRQRTLEAIERVRRDHARAGAEVTPDERLECEALRVSVTSLTPEQLQGLERVAYQPAARLGLAGALVRFLRALGRAAAGLVSRLMRRQRIKSPEAEPAVPSVTAEQARTILEQHRRFLILRPLVENVQRLERQMAVESQALASADERLAALIAEAGIECGDDLELGVAAFHEAWRGRQEYHAAVAAEEEAARHRAALLAGRSRQELESNLEEHVSSSARLVAAYPDLDGCQSAASIQELARLLASLGQRRHEQELAAGGLSQELRLTLERHRPPAEIEEDCERWQLRAAHLEGERAAAQMAKEAMEEAMTAVYRDFAPAVNSFLSEGMEFVTGGRYRRAHVDPASLQISLLVPETDQVITNPPVSHGTWTIAYVLMRIGLAQHMSSIGEPVPLVLDDPFVDVDSQRLPLALDFLLRISERLQILLFTKDESIVRWFEAQHLDGRQRLHHLESRALAPAAL